MIRIVLIVLCCGAAIPGCHLTGTVTRVVEPLEGQFVDVRNADGTTLMLADGRRVKLAGIRPDVNMGNLVGENRLLLFEEGDGIRAEISILSLPHPSGNPMGIVLFPTVRLIHAQRRDVGLESVRCGAARAAPEEIVDKVRRKAYVDAEEWARSHKLGLWGSRWKSGDNGGGDANGAKQGVQGPLERKGKP